VLSIFGSPDPGGFSSTLHNELLKPFEQKGIKSDIIHTYKADINPCTACGHCRDKPQCIFTDDMTQIYNIIRETDIITISSPVYFSSFPAPLKAFIDRCQLIWEERKRNNITELTKQGFLICAGGSEYNSMFKGILAVTRHFFNSTGVSFSEKNSILYSNTDSAHKISLEFLNKALYAGKALIK
jgi:multimeric flavodoxin WrbA